MAYRTHTPYVGFSHDTLTQQPRLRIGDRIDCDTCGQQHEVRGGKDKHGVESDTMLFYRCGEKVRLAGVAGRSVIGVKSDASGSI
jgi:hypothetical protein